MNAPQRRGHLSVGLVTAVALMLGTFVALVTGHAAPAGAQGYQDWPTFLQNVSRTSATTDPNLSVSNAPNLTLNEKFTTGGSVASSMAIVGTTGYVGSWDGNEYAFDVLTGKMLWKTNLGIDQDPACNPKTIGVTSSPAIVDGTLYVGGGGPYWYALDATTGAILWDVYTGPIGQQGAHYNWSSPLIYNGYGYIGIASNCDAPLVQGQLLQVDLSTHQIVNTYNFVPDNEVGGGVWTSPTLDTATNTIFVSTGTINDYTQTQSQAVVALDATTLAYKSSWQLPFEEAVSDSDWGTTPTLTTDSSNDQLVSLANKNGVLYTLNRNDLAAGPIWQREIAIGGDCPPCGDGSIASGAFANGVLYYAGGLNETNNSGSDGSISAFDPGTGAVLWTRQTEQPIIGAPAYVNGMIGEAEGNTFEVLNASTGALLYSYPLDQPVEAAISVAQSQFYVPDLDGSVYAFGLPAKTPPNPPPDPNCPTGLTCQDIGKPPIPGKESLSGQDLTVTASGVGIQHKQSEHNQFRFLWAPVTGDSQTSVEVVSQKPQQPRPEAGIMAAESLSPDSPYYAVMAFPNNANEGNPQPDVFFEVRPCWGCRGIELTKWYPAPQPVSIMLQRHGNVFSAGISFNGGASYQLVPGSTFDVDMPTTTLQGMFQGAEGAKDSTGTFTDWSVGAPLTTQLTPPKPKDACPSPWTCQDIGNPSPVGDTTAAKGSVILHGTGTGIGVPLDPTSDSFHFVDQKISGNESISAQVVAPASNPPDQEAGVMIRSSTSPTSPYYAVLLNPGGSATVTWRTYGDVTQRATVPLTSVKSPAWLQIDDYTDTSLDPPVTFLSALTSTDGTKWTPVLNSTTPIAMGSSYLVGLAATAAAPRVTPTVTFNNPTIAAVNNPPPGICPASYTCQDVGNEAIPGSQTYVPGKGQSQPTWTVSNSGGDIWSVYDSFRYVSQPFPLDPKNSPNGDGTISAEVLSQKNSGGPWMKTGVMIRAGTDDPQAPYYGVFVTPGEGIVVQWRTAEAAETNQDQDSTAPTTPVWVLASRYTDTAQNVVYYSASYSTDGVHFTYISGSEVALNLPSSLTAGLVSDSYNSAQLSTGTVTNLAQLSGSPPPPYVCPAGWSCADIGGALPPGDDSLSNNTWNEIGGGGDIWGTADAFHFVWQTLPGDGTVSAEVTSQQDTDPWAKAGPMLRESTDPGSPYYAAFVTPGNGVAVQWRATQGGSSNQLVVSGAVPVYLRVGVYTYQGQTYYSAYTSSDGVTWSAIPGSVMALSIPEPLLGGFGITSHDQGVGSAVTLSSVSVNPGEYPPPGVVCPAGWSCADIGGATPPGTNDLSGSTWTIAGGGSNIWNASDTFHYVWQTIPGDGGISAQVTSQSDSNAWAKAGVMLRGSTDPGAAFYAIYTTPGNGVVVQARTSQGGDAVQLSQISGAAPLYVEVSRSGSTFSAETSSDGTTWTPVPGSSLSIPALTGSSLAGMAVCSADPELLSASVFNAVDVTGG